MKHTLMAPAGVLGLLATLSRQYVILIILVAVVIVLDVISGLIRCFATGEALSSEKGTKGFWKKITLLFSLAFAFFLDVAIPLFLDVVSIKLPFERSLLFGSIVAVYIILNESISICENIYKANKIALPKWLKRLLTDAKNDIDKKGDKKDGNN